MVGTDAMKCPVCAAPINLDVDDSCPGCDTPIVYGLTGADESSTMHIDVREIRNGTSDGGERWRTAPKPD